MKRAFYRKYKDYTDQKFGNLTAIKPTEGRRKDSVLWLFKCDCGNEIIRLPNLLGKGNKTNCGCIKIKKKPVKRDNFFKDESNKVYKVYSAIFPNGKKYVGYTKQDINKRIYRHNKNAKEGIITRFATALRKYDYNVTWEIIKDNLSHKDAIQMEIDLIQKFNLLDKRFGYNMTQGGDGGVCTDGESEIKRVQKLKDFYSSDEMRKIQSYKNKIFTSKPENRDKMALIRGGKPFCCMETEEEFVNIAATARSFGGRQQNLSKHLRGKRRSFCGFHFLYLKDIIHE